jgi:F-type H+-transporting ATPase subunit delta
MRNPTLARRYAKALIEIGLRDGHHNRYVEELERVRARISSHPGLNKITRAPLLSRDRMKEIISVLGTEMGLSTTVHNFLNLLVDKDRIRYFDDVTDVARELLDEITEVTRATVTTAYPLSTEELDSIRESLERYTGKKVIVLHKQDPSIIGGIRAQIGDTILDHSIRAQLNRMRENLTRT